MKRLILIILVLIPFTASAFFGFGKSTKEKLDVSKRGDDIIYIESSDGKIVSVVKKYLVPMYDPSKKTLTLQYGGADIPINTYKNVSTKKAIQIYNQLYPGNINSFCLNDSGVFKCRPEILNNIDK